jgi:hypothetical protein
MLLLGDRAWYLVRLRAWPWGVAYVAVTRHSRCTYIEHTCGCARCVVVTCVGAHKYTALFSVYASGSVRASAVTRESRDAWSVASARCLSSLVGPTRRALTSRDASQDSALSLTVSESDSVRRDEVCQSGLSTPSPTSELRAREVLLLAPLLEKVSGLDSQSLSRHSFACIVIHYSAQFALSRGHSRRLEQLV